MIILKILFVLVNHKFNDIYNDKRDLFIKIEKNKF